MYESAKISWPCLLCNLFFSAQKPIKKYKAFGVLSHFLPDHIKISRCPRLPYRFWPELSTDGKQLHLQALYILSQGGQKTSCYWNAFGFFILDASGLLAPSFTWKAAISRRKHSPNDYVRLSNRSRGFGLNADDPWDIRHGGITVVSEQRIVQKKEISNWRLTKKQFQNQIDSPTLHWSYWWKLCDDTVPLFFKFASMVGYIRGKHQSFTPSGWQASRFRMTLPLQVFLNVFDKNCPLETVIPHISLYWKGQRAQPSQESAHPPHRCASFATQEPSTLAVHGRLCLVGLATNLCVFLRGAQSMIRQWYVDPASKDLWFYRIKHRDQRWNHGTSTWPPASENGKHHWQHCASQARAPCGEMSNQYGEWIPSPWRFKA